MNDKKTMGAVCPIGSATDGRKHAMEYFRQILWDKFKNPYNPKEGVVYGAKNIAEAKTKDTVITVAPEMLGFMAITEGLSDVAMRLTINIGNQTGVGTYEMLSQEIGINE
jgi:hypothetical protein